MKSTIALVAAVFCLFLSSCHRPVAYFQRTPHAAAARLPLDNAVVSELTPIAIQDSIVHESQPIAQLPLPALANQRPQPVEQTNKRIEQRLHRMQSLLETSAGKSTQQPQPKPKKKLEVRQPDSGESRYEVTPGIKLVAAD